MFQFTLNPVTFAWILATAGLVGAGIGLLLGLGILAWKEDKASKARNDSFDKPMAVRKGRKAERGFTLVEAMIVASILGIVAALVIPKVAPMFANDNRVSAPQR